MPARKRLDAEAIVQPLRLYQDEAQGLISPKQEPMRRGHL
jgi:hypothetical protein